MLTAETILGTFTSLERGGLTPPPDYGTPAGRQAAAKTWAMVLFDLTDEDLALAALAHLRAGDRDAAFWPKPGRLLALSSKGSSRFTADDAWGEVLRLLRLYGTAGGAPLAPGEPEPEPVVRETPVREVYVGDRLFRRVGGRESFVPGPKRFRLHTDPAVESAMHGALRAIGGWTALGALPADVGEQAPTAAAFRRAYDSARATVERVSIAAVLEDRRAGLRLLPGGVR